MNPFSASLSALFDQPEFVSFSGLVSIEGPALGKFELSRGYANRAERLPVTPQTRFGMASGSKIFTALAICQWVEAGRISLDTPLRAVLEGVPDTYNPQITLYHLLTHTSGIQDYADEEEDEAYEDLWIEQPMYRMRAPQDFLPLILKRPWMKKDLGVFSYNNAGFVWLGMVVEALSGQPFREVVQNKIFAPARMPDSGYFALDQLPGGTALGYIDEADGAWRTNQYAIPVVGGGDGGAFTTAADLRRFWQALDQGLLLGPELLDQMKTAQVSTSEAVRYGLGVWIRPDHGNDCFYVIGEDPGVYLYSGFYPQSGVTCSMFCNSSRFPFWKLTAKVREILAT